MAPALLAEAKISQGQVVTYRASVSKVDSTQGPAQYIVARGKERIGFEFKFKFQLEIAIHADGVFKKKIGGSIDVPELTMDELNDASPPYTCRSDARKWEPVYSRVASSCWPELQVAMRLFVEQAKQHWRERSG